MSSKKNTEPNSSHLEEDKKPNDALDYNKQQVIIPTCDVVVFPGVVFLKPIPDRYSLEAAQYAYKNQPNLVFATLKDPKVDKPRRQDLHSVATLCGLLQLAKQDDGSLELMCVGIERVQLAKVVSSRPCLQMIVKPYPLPSGDATPNEVHALQIKELLTTISTLTTEMSSEWLSRVQQLDDPKKLAYFLGHNMPFSISQRQELLKSKDLTSMLQQIYVYTNLLVEKERIAKRLRDKAERSMEKYQQEFFLHEQMKAIQQELGEDAESETRELWQKIESAGMPAATLEHAQREFRKMKQLPEASPDRAIIETYLDWMVRFPWAKQTTDSTDLAKAQHILDSDHYGLNEVKERILDFIAVHAQHPDPHGPSLCLVGPPGVGKTSIGQSIARTLGREFNRTSLGGVHDEAEIRGHRRTYVGALPGRIIQAICHAGVANPVLMLDEIDKLGKDYRGDPAAALLEALDPEQNREFRDHYMATPTDLSQVVFVLTANVTDTIPPALLDRLEVIRIPGYTATEKQEIAQRFLVPKALKNHGLTTEHFSLADATIPALIQEYTREAGVRNLEREIAKLCRKRVRQIVSSKKPKKRFKALSPQEMRELLGVAPYATDQNPGWSTPGCVHGLSWTSVGGELLDIEVCLIPGKGKLLLTGNLGNVM